MSKVPALLLALGLSFGAAYAQQPSFDANGLAQVDLDYVSSGHPHSLAISPHLKPSPGHVAQGIPNIDSIQNFSGHYMTAGVDSIGNTQNKWYYNTVGNLPQQGGTTTFNAPVVPVIVQLLASNNTVAITVDPSQYVQPVLNSPVFQNSTYSSSSVPTQFTDAVQRAEYYQSAKADWHTLLNPVQKQAVTMKIPYGSWSAAFYRGTSTVAYVLVDIDAFQNALFPSTATDTTTPVGAAENAGYITTKDISTFLFNNVFLYFNGDVRQCCVIGFHSYDVEPGDATNGNRERRYVLNYSSWISPGLFSSVKAPEPNKFQDITALSHEIAETFNDPFVASDGLHNITPWWLAPNGNCQNNLETGDVVEGLRHAQFPVTLNNVIYHPQNEALLQWFESLSASDAIGGAYSYPDATVLTSPNVSQNVNCQ